MCIQSAFEKAAGAFVGASTGLMATTLFQANFLTKLGPKRLCIAAMDVSFSGIRDYCIGYLAKKR